MNEEQATAIAKALDGEAWQSGGNIWLVLIHRDDGKLVVISDEIVCEYENEEAFHEGARATSSVYLVA